MVFLEKYRILISLGIALVLSVIAISIWGYNQQRWEESLSGKVEDTGQLLVQQFRVILTENLDRLENLKHRLELTNGNYFQYWEQDAARIIESSNTLSFMEWIDSTMVIQRVQPYEGNEEAVGLDISQLEYRKSDWERARSDSTFNMTHWLELVQGKYSFLVDEPVYINGEFYGTITAGMDFTSRFDQVLQGLDEYNIQIADGSGTVFYKFGSSEGTESFRDLTTTHRIEVGDANQSIWTVTMVPNALFGVVNSAVYNDIVLVLTIMLGLFLAVSFYLTQKSAAAERTSKLANQKLRALIESAPVGIYVIDAEGYVTDFWNPAAEEMLGWKQEEVLGNFLPQVTDEFEESFKGLMDEIKMEGGVSNREVTRKRKDGTKRTFRVYISSIVGSDEQMLVVFEDITKEKEYAERLKKTLEEKDILLSEIHHRVKNNLAIIIGLIELQNAEVQDETTKSNLFETKNRIYSISGVHELLYQTDNFSDISFSEYINQLINRLKDTFDSQKNPVTINKNITGLRMNINQAIPLGLLLNELITNSYKHAFNGVNEPKISLDVNQSDGFIEIEYKDNGKGVDYDEMQQSPSLGITIIKTSLSQLSADYQFLQQPKTGFGINLRFPENIKGAHSNL
ncbi:MAG: PAS domain S-box protein [Bacteroidetes bacterium]|nr:PAS domain S-box protein [Bacteroidota bacterium]